MKTILLKFIFVVLSIIVTSQVYGRKVFPKNTLSTGVNWGTASNWKDETGATLTALPLTTDTVIVKDNAYLIANLVKAEVAGLIIENGSTMRFGTGTASNSLPSLIVNGDFIINEGGALYAGGSADATNGGYQSGRSLTINGDLVNNGIADLSRINSATNGTLSYENGPNVLTMGPPSSPRATRIYGTGTFVPAKIVDGKTEGVGVIRFLTINNPNGVTLDVPISISQGLYLLDGVLYNKTNLTLDNTKYLPSSASGVTTCRMIRSQSSSLDKPYTLGENAKLVLEYVKNQTVTGALIEEGNEMPTSRTISGLTINNSEGLNLLTDVTLTAATTTATTIAPLTLTSGVINIPAGKFLISTDITKAGLAGSATSYINGGFALALSTTPETRTFPIGAEGQNRKVVLSGISGTDGTLVSFAVTSSFAGTAGSGVTNISSRRWLGTVSNGTLTGYSAIGIDFQSDDGSVIDRLALSATEDGSYNGMAVGTNTTAQIKSADGVYTDMGYFALANNSNTTLPVEFISFNAAADNNKVILKWSTASENGNDYFVIERLVSGTEFSKVAEVKAGGFPNQLQEYVAYDNSPLSAVNYYRLSQVDKNGTKAILSTKAVDFSLNTKKLLAIYPNPVNREFNIEVSNFTGESLYAVVTNLQGKVIHDQTFSVKQSGFFRGLVSLDQKPSPGVYLLKVTGKNFSQTQKILVR